MPTPTLPGRAHRRPVTHEVRVYVPLTAELARRLRETRSLPGEELVAFAVTEAVTSADPAGDTEAHEWQAMQDAAEHAIASGHPVVVLAADLRPDEVRASAGTSRVQVLAPLPVQRVASCHVGDDVLGAGGPGEGEEIELSWYDASELGEVVALLERANGSPA